MSPMAALWRWPLRVMVAHVLLFVTLATAASAAARLGGLSVVGGVDPYLGGSVLYFVLLLPLVLVLGMALGVVAGGALQLWGARPLLAATVVGLTAAALALAALSWFDGWERIPAAHRHRLRRAGRTARRSADRARRPTAGRQPGGGTHPARPRTGAREDPRRRIG